MAKASVGLVAAVCAVLVTMALVNASVDPIPIDAVQPFTVNGKVYADTCQIGYVTPVSHYFGGASVRLECRDRQTQKLVYSAETVTDKDGCYKFTVPEDQGDRICHCVLVKTHKSDCKRVDPACDKAPVVLTANSGMSNRERFANPLACIVDQPLAACPLVLQQYHIYDAEDDLI